MLQPRQECVKHLSLQRPPTSRGVLSHFGSRSGPLSALKRPLLTSDTLIANELRIDVEVAFRPTGYSSQGTDHWLHGNYTPPPSPMASAYPSLQVAYATIPSATRQLPPQRDQMTTGEQDQRRQSVDATGDDCGIQLSHNHARGSPKKANLAGRPAGCRRSCPLLHSLEETWAPPPPSSLSARTVSLSHFHPTHIVVQAKKEARLATLEDKNKNRKEERHL